MPGHRGGDCGRRGWYRRPRTSLVISFIATPQHSHTHLKQELAADAVGAEQRRQLNPFGLHLQPGLKQCSDRSECVIPLQRGRVTRGGASV